MRAARRTKKSTRKKRVKMKEETALEKSGQCWKRFSSLREMYTGRGGNKGEKRKGPQAKKRGWCESMGGRREKKPRRKDIKRPANDLPKNGKNSTQLLREGKKLIGTRTERPRQSAHLGRRQYRGEVQRILKSGKRGERFAMISHNMLNFSILLYFVAGTGCFARIAQRECG